MGLHPDATTQLITNDAEEIYDIFISSHPMICDVCGKTIRAAIEADGKIACYPPLKNPCSFKITNDFFDKDTDAEYVWVRCIIHIPESDAEWNIHKAELNAINGE